MNRLSLLCLFIMASTLQASEVVKISKNKMNMAITHDLGTEWKVGQNICVQGNQDSKICGKVVKVKKAGAICKMNSALNGIVPGDEVTADEANEPIVDPMDQEGSASGLEDSPTPKSSKKKSKRKFGLGVRGGVVLAKMTSDVDIDNRTALDAGIFLDVPIGGNIFALEPGLAFVQKGAETSISATGLDYIDLRLLMKARVIEGSFTPVFYFGPYSALLLSAKLNSTAGTTDVKDYYKSVDFGILGGLGFDFRVSPSVDLGLAAFYSLGLLSLDADIQGVTIENPPKNRGLHFGAHFVFQL
ncbi:MAG: porin family protein [Deltaproteobacteria bacterium]